MFTLKIFFLGLIAFVPNQDGTELNVLLVDGRQGYTTSDGTEIGPHYPFLLARSASCQGDCERSLETAEFFFSKYGSGASERLGDALLSGGAWRLSESNLSIPSWATPAGPTRRLALERTAAAVSADPKARLKAAVPNDPRVAGDLRWFANLDQIHPGLGGVDPDHLAERPHDGWIVARLRLDRGRVSTYRLAGVGDQVVPIDFRPLSGGRSSGFTQALADSVVAEIDIEGDSVEIFEEGFGGGNRRTMKLTPQDGVVEIALLNTPPIAASHVHTTANGATNPGDSASLVGKHFEVFYELARVKLPKASREVPHVDTRVGVPWSTIYPRKQGDSELLRALGYDDPRTAFERVICPLGWLSIGN